MIEYYIGQKLEILQNWDDIQAGSIVYVASIICGTDSSGVTVIEVDKKNSSVAHELDGSFRNSHIGGPYAVPDDYKTHYSDPGFIYCSNYRNNFKILSTTLNENNNMGLKESFVLGLTSEPKKSFRKANVTDGDDMLTSEGQTVFLTWLLHSIHADEFKKQVVDEIINEKKKEKETE